MQTEPIAGGAVPSGTVHGLGVCDALRIELLPVQLPWLIDELEEMRGPLEEALGCASPGDEAAALRYELRLLRRLRAQLPPAGHAGPFTLVGPAVMVGEVVRGTLRNVAAALAELAQARPAADPEPLRATAAAAAAWTRTCLDCRAVEAFSFDPEAEPHGIW
jgi:hypothetical protein